MTYRTDTVRYMAQEYAIDEDKATNTRRALHAAIRETYAAGGVTLQELAKATGLSKQRISVIVREGSE